MWIRNDWQGTWSLVTNICTQKLSLWYSNQASCEWSNLSFNNLNWHSELHSEEFTRACYHRLTPSELNITFNMKLNQCFWIKLRNSDSFRKIFFFWNVFISTVVLYQYEFKERCCKLALFDVWSIYFSITTRESAGTETAKVMQLFRDFSFRSFHLNNLSSDHAYLNWDEKIVMA